MVTQRWLFVALVVVVVTTVGARPAEDAPEGPEPAPRTARASYGSLKSQPSSWGLLYSPQQIGSQQPVAGPTVIHRLPSAYQPQPQSFQWNSPRDVGYTNLYTIFNGQLVTPVKQPVYHVPITTSRLPLNRSPFTHFTTTTYNQGQNDGLLQQLNEFSALHKSTSGSTYWGSIGTSGSIFTPINQARYDDVKAQKPPPRVGNFGVLGKHGFGNIFQKPKSFQNAISNSGDMKNSSENVKTEADAPAKQVDREQNLSEGSVANRSSDIELKMENVNNKSDKITEDPSGDRSPVSEIENFQVDSKETINQKQSALLAPALSALRDVLDRRPEWNDSQDILEWRKNYSDPNRPPGTTTLILKPEAEAVADCNGTAIANPISHAVVPLGQPVDVHFEPRAVAVAGPGGTAKAHSDLVVSFVAATVSDEAEKDITSSSPQ